VIALDAQFAWLLPSGGLRPGQFIHVSHYTPRSQTLFGNALARETQFRCAQRKQSFQDNIIPKQSLGTRGVGCRNKAPRLRDRGLALHESSPGRAAYEGRAFGAKRIPALDGKKVAVNAFGATNKTSRVGARDPPARPKSYVAFLRSWETSCWTCSISSSRKRTSGTMKTSPVLACS
jgi:hypothetical protein